MTTRLNRFWAALLMALALFLFPLGQMAEASPVTSCVSACACCCLAENASASPSSCCGSEMVTQKTPEESSQDGCTDSCDTCHCVATPAAPTLALAPATRLAQPAWHDFAFAAIHPDQVAPRAEAPPVPPPRLS